MNYCNRCRIQVNESDSYCLRCGNKIESAFVSDQGQPLSGLKNANNPDLSTSSHSSRVVFSRTNFLNLGLKRTVKQALFFGLFWWVIGLLLVVAVMFGLTRLIPALGAIDLLDTLGRMLWCLYCTILYAVIYFKKKLQIKWAVFGGIISFCALISAFMAMFFLSIVTTVEGSNRDNSTCPEENI